MKKIFVFCHWDSFLPAIRSNLALAYVSRTLCFGLTLTAFNYVECECAASRPSSD